MRAGAMLWAGRGGSAVQWDACWLPERTPPETLGTPAQIAAWELAAEGIPHRLMPRAGWGERFLLEEAEGRLTVCGGETGLLYGAYCALQCRRLGLAYPKGAQSPAFALRMLNHWDNPDGSVERGYAGRSLFFEGGSVRREPERLRAYARLLASVGVNAVCINNVNVSPEARALAEERLLPDVAALAALFAPFGVRLMLAVDFAMPLYHGLATADPLDGSVAAWWRARAALVYRHVPTLAGFLVKADSEGRPGPYAYGRNHAEGANMLADALRPFGGVLVWRCFVYQCRQDWRDTRTRPAHGRL